MNSTSVHSMCRPSSLAAMGCWASTGCCAVARSSHFCFVLFSTIYSTTSTTIDSTQSNSTFFVWILNTQLLPSQSPTVLDPTHTWRHAVCLLFRWLTIYLSVLMDLLCASQVSPVISSSVTVVCSDIYETVALMFEVFLMFAFTMLALEIMQKCKFLFHWTIKLSLSSSFFHKLTSENAPKWTGVVWARGAEGLIGMGI